jgi:hypothetical protein
MGVWSQNSKECNMRYSTVVPLAIKHRL